mgnify:CR=1 FL=1
MLTVTEDNQYAGAVGDHPQARAGRLDVLDDVRGKQYGHLLGHFGDQVSKAEPLLGVQTGGRFVDEDDPGAEVPPVCWTSCVAAPSRPSGSRGNTETLPPQ